MRLYRIALSIFVLTVAMTPVMAQDLVMRSKTALANAEKQLTQAWRGFEAGAMGTDDVLAATVDFENAKIELAKAQHEESTILESLKTIVGARETAFDRVGQAMKQGATSATDLRQARITLAQARIRLETYAIVQESEQSLQAALTASQAGTLGREELETARKAVAQSRLKWEQVETGK